LGIGLFPWQGLVSERSTLGRRKARRFVLSISRNFNDFVRMNEDHFIKMIEHEEQLVAFRIIHRAQSARDHFALRSIQRNRYVVESVCNWHGGTLLK
jgi:hypothetical protein